MGEKAFLATLANQETIIEDVGGVKTDTERILGLLTAKKPKRYGFRVKIGEAQPMARVEYLYDAEGMTPAFMDYAAGAFSYGSWADAWFITGNYPVMLNYDGTEDYRLDPNNYAKKLDGTASDVANTAYEGNAMAAIPLCWVKRWEEGGYRCVVFCEEQYDESYKAYAHTKADGTLSPVFYYPMFKGCEISGKLRSLSGQWPQYQTTAEHERETAQANTVEGGAAWDLRTWSKDELIADLLVLISKSTNSQAAFGEGHSEGYVNNAGQHYGHIQSGTLKDKGQFFGFNDTAHEVKVLHMEGFWGGRWDRFMGSLYINGVFYTKMTPEGNGYNFTGEGYTKVPTVPLSGTNGAYIKATTQTDLGAYPVGDLSGSDATYDCDGCWYKADITAVGLRGGNCSAASECGARYLNWNVPASYANWNLGGSPSCEGPSCGGSGGTNPPGESAA